MTFYAPAAAALFADRTGLPPGGAETQQLILARELADRGYRVAMIVLGGSGVRAGEIDGVCIFTQAPVRTRIPVVRELLSLSRTVRALWTARADTYVRRGVAGVTGLLAITARLIRARFVFSAASLADFARGSGAERDPKRAKLYELGIRLADEIVVQTEEQANRCAQRFGRRARVIRSIAEECEPRNGIPNAFLWVGRINENKRPGGYLALARALPEAHFRMVAVPSPADTTGLERRLREDAASIPNLELLSPRPRAALTALYDSAAAIVSTSGYEGMPNVFLEAWARGVPALCLTHDPDGLVAAEGLGGFANGSFERLEQLASEIWRSRADQGAVAARCRDFVAREHGLEANVDHWIDVLRIEGT